MRSITIITIIILSFAVGKLKAQVVSNEDRCYILYDYDAAGQRTMRYYHCFSSNDNPMHPPVGVEVYPNPTNGPFTVLFTDAIDHCSYRITNIVGNVVAQGDVEQCQQIGLDLSPQPPGTMC